MGTNFSFKFAWRNIQSNKQIYLPYTMAAIITVAMFQMMSSLMMNPFVEEHSSLLIQLFALGTVVVALFSIIFIFYTNSFLMKRRKKELGLYNVLGLEKKHVRRVLWMESSMIGAFSILVGIIVGNLLGQLGFLFLNYLLKLPISMEYAISIESVGITAILFVGIFFMTFVYNATQVTLANPIKLLKSDKEGEKEPKSSPLLFLIGLISLGSGYFISIIIQNPISALIQFFLAVLLVIIGTYLLFTAGSIIILKMLKRNRAFYYQSGPFISVSGMLYRMKQHAAGLANITILSTMVIVVISTTVTLFVGTEETLLNRFPAENNINIMSEYGLSGDEFTKNVAELEAEITNLTEADGVETVSLTSFRYVTMMMRVDGQKFGLGNNAMRGTLPTMVLMIPLEDYNQEAAANLELAESELYIHTEDSPFTEETLELGGQTFNVTESTEFPAILNASGAIVNTLIVIAPNTDTIDDITAFYNPDSNPFEMYWEGGIHWDTTIDSEEGNLAYADIMDEETQNLGLDIGAFYESRSANRQEWLSVNGGFLFLGLFLGGLFTIGAALITYFKQVSEGYDDRERIQIMQKVGLDKETTRKATRSQIVWMFTLPILMASIHTAFAFPILQKLLVLFGITNKILLLSVTVGVVVVFALIYWIIYRITSIVYLKIVE